MLRIARRNRPRRAGLTLIELVMVLVVLTALAALIVPMVDNMRRTSDKATASSTMKSAMENIGLFRAQTGKYPNNFDSLIETDGTTPLSSLKDSDNYSAQALLPSEEAGLTKMGITEVMDHDLSAAYRGNPGSSGVVNRDLDSTGGSTLLVVVNGGDVTSQGQDIIDSIYPPNDVTDTDGDGNTDVDSEGFIAISPTVQARLVVLGIGPNNTAVGKTMVTPPTYMGVDGLTQYNRFLAVFAVYSGPTQTKRAQLKGVLDSAGDFLNQELIEVIENNLE